MATNTTTDLIFVNEFANYVVLEVREKIETIVDGKIVNKAFRGYTLPPDADTFVDVNGQTALSQVSDQLVVNKFNEVMTEQIKYNYEQFKSGLS